VKEKFPFSRTIFRCQISGCLPPQSRKPLAQLIITQLAIKFQDFSATRSFSRTHRFLGGLSNVCVI